MALGSIHHAGSGISAYQNAVNLSPQAKTSEEAKKLNLRDEETVAKAESRYDLDGKLKDEHRPVAMPKLDKEKEDETDPFSLKGKGDDKTEKDGRKQDGFSKDLPMCQCETCRKRRYQDDSTDSAVSFQSATRMSPAAAAYRVRGHEMEHVRRENAKADQEGKRVVSQFVRIKTDTCEECGRIYVSGGLTYTVTRADLRDFHSMFMLGFDGSDLKSAENA
ncbi:MAG: hypothetical protein NC084_03530 [Bacteroides sp.]|nr:hypothetical protein [Roseburia sp.]MCM1461769.1 hypothetical protein [Bacteroides sp.]